MSSDVFVFEESLNWDQISERMERVENFQKVSQLYWESRGLLTLYKQYAAYLHSAQLQGMCFHSNFFLAEFINFLLDITSTCSPTSRNGSVLQQSHSKLQIQYMAAYYTSKATIIHFRI